MHIPYFLKIIKKNKFDVIHQEYYMEVLGRIEGLFISMYGHNIVYKCIRYKNSYKHGICKIYHQDGKLNRTEVYNNGEQTSMKFENGITGTGSREYYKYSV